MGRISGQGLARHIVQTYPKAARVDQVVARNQVFTAYLLRVLGLLPGDTVFAGEKVRTRMTGTVLAGPRGLEALAGAPVEGYEIHMGRTTLEPGTPPFCLVAPLGGGEAREDGAVLGNVWGTYLHGLLDSGELLARLWRALAEKKGLSPEEAPACDPAAYREEQYRTLAAALRQSLDMDRIYRILEEGI